MDTNKRTAIFVGVLFIVGTAAGIISVVCTNSILNDPDYLSKVAINPNQITLGALFVLIMGFALAMIPAVIYPVLKKQDEVMALGYIIFRGALEAFTYVVIVISWLLLVALSREYGIAGNPNALYFQTLGNLLRQAAQVGATMTAMVFPLGATMLYVVFYQSKLIPRWLSVWGLIGVGLHLAYTGLGGMFALVPATTTIWDVLNLPIFLQEMVMAVWLIVKGFNPLVISPEKAKQIE